MNDVAVRPDRQGEMPDFAVFVGTILTERMSVTAEPARPLAEWSQLINFA